MSVTIKGTDTSAAAPSFAGSDGDTGLYFPAAGQAAIATNGVQGLLVDENQAVRINGASAATSDSKVNTQVNSAGSLITLAEFRNLDYTAGTKSFVRVRNNISAGSTYSSYFGQGADGKTYIIANNSARGGDIVIDGNTGAITTPSQPAFKARMSTNGNTNISNGSVFPFDVAMYNIGSCFNTSTYRFTAPVAGVYAFTYHAYKNGSGTPSLIAARVNTNAIFRTRLDGTSDTVIVAAFSTYLNANDYVDVVNDSGVTFVAFDNTTGSYTSFEGYLVG